MVLGLVAILQTVQLGGVTRLRLPTRPHHPPPTPYLLKRAIRGITVVVKKVAQNPAVLAS